MSYAYEKFYNAITDLAIGNNNPRNRLINAVQNHLILLEVHKPPKEIEKEFQEFLDNFDEFKKENDEDTSELIDQLMSIYNKLIKLEKF